MPPEDLDCESEEQDSTVFETGLMLSDVLGLVFFELTGRFIVAHGVVALCNLSFLLGLLARLLVCTWSRDIRLLLIMTLLCFALRDCG